MCWGSAGGEPGRLHSDRYMLHALRGCQQAHRACPNHIPPCVPPCLPPAGLCSRLPSFCLSPCPLACPAIRRPRIASCFLFIIFTPPNGMQKKKSKQPAKKKGKKKAKKKLEEEEEDEAESE